MTRALQAAVLTLRPARAFRSARLAARSAAGCLATPLHLAGFTGLFVLAFMALAPSAGAFELALPLRCTLGQDCYIQQYLDHDPGPGARDFTCGTLAYDGHEGTDFAVPTDAAMQAGVAVLAAAPGVVRGVRDGMPDIRVSDPGAPALAGRDCGNGVAITHEGGWETQYCHMKQGSVLVKPGQRVETGTELGLVGLSGRTEFPHLHLTLRRDGAMVDPFATDDLATCGSGTAGLWAGGIAHQPGGRIAAGFAATIPDYATVRAGTVPPPDAQAPALVFWLHLYGVQAGDRLELALTGPEGALAGQQITLDRTQAQTFRALGKRLSAARWPAGAYTAQYALLRDGKPVTTGRETLTLP